MEEKLGNYTSFFYTLAQKLWKKLLFQIRYYFYGYNMQTKNSYIFNATVSDVPGHLVFLLAVCG